MGSLLPILTFLAALGSGLMAGFFFAFSPTVMWALERQPPGAGISAMQAINVVVLNPIFLGVFFGTAILSLVLDIVALVDWSAPGCGYLVAGSLLYFAGTFLVTLLFNVPLNNKLAAVKPNSAEARRCGRTTSVCGRHGTMCARWRRSQRWRPSSWLSAKCGVRRAAPRPPRSGSAWSRCG